MSGAFDIVMESRREIVEKIIRMMEQEGFFFKCFGVEQGSVAPIQSIVGCSL